MTGRFTFGNHLFCAGLKLSLAELIGKDDFDIHPPDLAEKYRRDDRHVIETGQIFETIEERAVIGGQLTDTHTIKAPIRDESGQIVGVQIMFWDVTDRVQAEEALARLAAIVESSDDAIIGKTLDGEIVSWNAGAEKLYGYSAAEAIGRSISILRPPERPDDLPHILEQIRRGERIHQFETTRQTKEGRIVEVSLTLSPIKNVAGQIVGVSTIARDITARKRAEEKVAASEVELRALFASMRDVVLVIDREGVYRKIAPTNPALLVGPSEELLGKTLWDVFPTEQAEIFLEAIRQTLETCQTTQIEYKLNIEGRPVWFSAYISPLDKASTLWVARDITERKRAEEALRESEARLRQMTSSMREALWLRDTRTLEVLYVNPAYEEVWGRTCESLYQDPRSFLDAVHPEDKKRVMQVIQKQYQGLFFNQEYRIIRPDGSVRWIWGRTFPIRDEAGQLVRVTAIAEDITERKQMEDALRELNATLEQRVADRTRRLYEANAQLSELDQLKDQFISRISHELRTPLTNIISYLDLLEHGKPEKHAQYLQVINEQTAQLRKLIESLLEVTQKSVNEAGVHVAPTDLNQLVSALLTEIAPRAAQRGLTLTSALPPELPFVSADGRLLAQAMSKLAANALNYTPAGGAIDLATAEVIDAGATWITFTIRDSGPGIAPDERDRIFDRFYRGRAAADYKTPGVGLGLSVSRDILTSLDGRLTVDSQPGEGAMFTAWLKPV